MPSPSSARKAIPMTGISHPIEPIIMEQSCTAPSWPYPQVLVESLHGATWGQGIGQESLLTSRYY